MLTCMGSSNQEIELRTANFSEEHTALLLAEAKRSSDRIAECSFDPSASAILCIRK